MLLKAMLKEVEDVEGTIIECGVGHGNSAQELIDANQGKKKIILVDSFEGLPEPRNEDGESPFKAGMYKEDYETIKKKFANCPNVTIIKGWIPEVLNEVEDEFFSFIHLDLDLYKPTLDALIMLYKRVNRGGTIMVHDKSQIGVHRAIVEFLLEDMDYFVVRNLLWLVWFILHIV